MKKTNTCFIFFILLLILNACSKKETSCVKNNQNISLLESDKKKIPYIGTDTLIFISNTNDTATCIGTGKRTYQACEDAGGNPDCPLYTATRCYENVTWNFKDVVKSFSINFELTQAKNVTDHENHSFWAYDFLIDINNDAEFYNSISSITPVAENYLAVANFNGKDYHDVYYFYKDINDTTSKIYYNIDQGLLRIELNNQQQIWNLQ